MSSLILLKSMLFANVLQKSRKRKKLKKKSSRLSKKSKNSNGSACRICNDEKGDIPIFDNFIQPNIPEEIQHFTGVTVSQCDKLPKHMCQSCLDLLNGCIMFRDMCQKNNDILIELSIKKEYNNCENENIVEHREISDNESYDVPSPVFSDNSELWGCATCNKEFLDLKSYNSHLKECNKQTAPKDPNGKKLKIKSFLCDICGKTARSRASLIIHMGIHENVFPFKCDVCPYKGRTNDLLKVHKRSHLLDKPFKCMLCPKACSTSSNLAKHVRHVHSSTRPYKCSYCDRAFSYQHDMKRHIRDIHLRQGTVECDVCKKKFNTKKILQGHRSKIHKIKGERQGRLPKYLQCQIAGGDHIMNQCDVNY